LISGAGLGFVQSTYRRVWRPSGSSRCAWPNIRDITETGLKGDGKVRLSLEASGRADPQLIAAGLSPG
jgi:hypothetical protein